MNNIKILKKLNDWSYLIFVLGYDILQSMLNLYDIPCDVAFEYCTNLHSTYISSPESEQDKSDYECLQDYVNNHMHEIESEIIKLSNKYSDTVIVKCINCGKQLTETEIIYDGDEDMEFCPYCGEGGRIRNLSNN